MISCWARLVTMDETWVCHYDPETKQQSMEWRNSFSPRPQKFRVQKSAGKFHASIFLGPRRHPPIDYLPKGLSINAEYYSSLLVQLKDILKEKRQQRESHQEVLFLPDIAPAHRALTTQRILAYLGFQCLDHPPFLWIWPRRTTTCSLDCKNNWKVAIFRPTRKSLLPRRPGWTDDLLNFFCVA